MRTARTFARPLLLLAALASAASLSTPALAAVTQPDGTVMPLVFESSEVSLQELFDFREGEGVMDAQEDAGTQPATFRPLCDFTAQLLLHETGNKSPMGWYNSPSSDTPPNTVCDEMTGLNDQGDPCSENDIFILVPGDVVNPPYGEANDPLNNPGDIFTGAEIASHEHYAGGAIGFALLTNQKHYSEARLNPECVGDTCTDGDRWIPTIMYASATSPQSFYMCSEDQPVGPTEWGGNDGDFNDYVFVFTGLVCTGSGEACDTGLPGICSAGLTDCAGADGESECKPARTAGDEECNGLDDDCDGELDEGDDLCPEGELCVKARCVPRCGTGEFRCRTDFTCVEGACVESACVDVECEAGDVCIGGECLGPCDDVVCPQGQACLDGACIDPCEGIECGDGLVCQGGACIVECTCAGCEEGACDAASGRCVDADCVGVSCEAGTHCSAGVCVDDCEGAVCPGGAECSNGQCGSPLDGSGATGSGGSGTGGGISIGSGAANGSGGSGANGAGASGGQGSVGSRDVGDSGGCGCRLSGNGQSAPALAALLLGGLLFGRRRARSRR